MKTEKQLCYASHAFTAPRSLQSKSLEASDFDATAQLHAANSRVFAKTVDVDSLMVSLKSFIFQILAFVPQFWDENKCFYCSSAEDKREDQAGMKTETRVSQRTTSSNWTNLFSRFSKSMELISFQFLKQKVHEDAQTVHWIGLGGFQVQLFVILGKRRCSSGWVLNLRKHRKVGVWNKPYWPKVRFRKGAIWGQGTWNKSVKYNLPSRTPWWWISPTFSKWFHRLDEDTHSFDCSSMEDTRGEIGPF